MLVTPPEPIKGGTREMLGFETLTLVPFDRRLIDPALLTRDELAWLNAYHAEVRRKIEPLAQRRRPLMAAPGHGPHRLTLMECPWNSGYRPSPPS